MALTALIAKISAPIISIRHPETFQIAATLPIPQPSTLVGALGYCYGTFSGAGLNAMEQVKRVIIAARAKLLSETAIIAPIILRRFRILDKGFEGKEGEKPFQRACENLRGGNIEEFRRILEGELTDALYREYLSQASLKCIWIVREPMDNRMLLLLQRLGDTESLITVIDVWTSECSPEEVDETSTNYPFTIEKDNLAEISGEYSLMRMCDENRAKKLFYVPCKKKINVSKDGSKYFTYIPTKIDVKFRKPFKILQVDGEIIVGG